MATYNQMLEEDSQVIESSFEESNDSSYAPDTPSSVPQTVPDTFHETDTDGSTMDWQNYNDSVTSMEIGDVSQCNEAQESLMDVSYYTANSSCKCISTLRLNYILNHFYCS